jgi:hypothetical protein
MPAAYLLRIPPGVGRIVPRLLPEQLVGPVEHPPLLVAQVAGGLPGPDRARQGSERDACGNGIAAEGAILASPLLVSIHGSFQGACSQCWTIKADDMP